VLHFPVVLVDRTFWSPLNSWISDEPLALGMVSPEDLQLLTITDEVEEAVQTVLDCYEDRCADQVPHTPAKADPE
jgi:predicted Rossmann-fold nucleotide-binding protein